MGGVSAKCMAHRLPLKKINVRVIIWFCHQQLNLKHLHFLKHYFSLSLSHTQCIIRALMKTGENRLQITYSNQIKQDISRNHFVFCIMSKASIKENGLPLTTWLTFNRSAGVELVLILPRPASFHLIVLLKRSLNQRGLSLGEHYVEQKFFLVQNGFPDISVKEC